MTGTEQASDKRVGVSLLFGFVALLAALATLLGAYLAEIQGSESLQILSGVGLAATIVAGGLVIAALHMFQ